MGFQVHRGKTVAETGVTKLWELHAKDVEKVNAMIVEHKKLIIGGFQGEGKGIIEILTHV